MQLPTTLLAAAVFAVTVVACSGTSTGTGNGAGAGTGMPNAGGGDCPAGGCTMACNYYGQCKGTSDASALSACNNECAKNSFTQQQLDAFLQLDCQSVVTYVETGKLPGGGATPPPAPGGDCTNCAWDGSSCIWLSPSTGLYSACSDGNAYCPNH